MLIVIIFNRFKKIIFTNFQFIEDIIWIITFINKERENIIEIHFSIIIKDIFAFCYTLKNT